MTTEETNYITDEVKALVGKETDWSELSPPLSPSEIRRFTQGIMDNDPIYWDEEFAKSTRYKGLVAPPLFPSFGVRRSPGSPDPLERFKTDPEWDGLGGGGAREGGLPPVNLPLVRTVNGGVEAEFFQYARPGERVRSKQRYADIRQRQGSTGPMVIITTENIWENDKGELLAIIRNTGIRR